MTEKLRNIGPKSMAWLRQTGIRSLDDVSTMMHSGADKVAINSAAVKDPTLITRASERFGAQCVVVADRKSVV